jgi:glycosyltransferase involved in cell wall biosynthesis
VPVLASRIDALTEIYGDAALYVDASDPEDIARGLTTLATNGAVQRDMRERGLNRVRQFSWRATAEATRQIYLECLEGRKRR